MDLTFASVLLRIPQAKVKSETALELMFANVPLVLTFVKEPVAMGYECQNRTFDADTMLAAAGKYKEGNTQIERVCPMIILYGLDLWATVSPLLTPRWQQGVASLKRLLREKGVLH